MANIDPGLKPFLDKLAELLADHVERDLKDVAKRKADANKMEEIVKVLEQILEKGEKEDKGEGEEL